MHNAAITFAYALNIWDLFLFTVCFVMWLVTCSSMTYMELLTLCYASAVSHTIVNYRTNVFEPSESSGRFCLSNQKVTGTVACGILQ